MKRTSNRRLRYKKILQRLWPDPSPLFVLEIDEVMADLDPGVATWRNRA